MTDDLTPKERLANAAERIANSLDQIAALLAAGPALKSTGLTEGFGTTVTRQSLADEALDLYARLTNPVPAEPPTTETDADGWVAHTAGPCPVEPHRRVDVRFRNGQESTNSEQARFWAWMDDPDDQSRPEYDIIAYRLHPTA